MQHATLSADRLRPDPNRLSYNATEALSAPPPRSCWWSYAAASSPPRNRRHDTWDDSGGLARTAAGLRRASSQHTEEGDRVRDFAI